MVCIIFCLFVFLGPVVKHISFNCFIYCLEDKIIVMPTWHCDVILTNWWIYTGMTYVSLVIGKLNFETNLWYIAKQPLHWFILPVGEPNCYICVLHRSVIWWVFLVWHFIILITKKCRFLFLITSSTQYGMGQSWPNGTSHLSSKANNIMPWKTRYYYEIVTINYS